MNEIFATLRPPITIFLMAGTLTIMPNRVYVRPVMGIPTVATLYVEFVSLKYQSRVVSLIYSPVVVSEIFKTDEVSYNSEAGVVWLTYHPIVLMLKSVVAQIWLYPMAGTVLLRYMSEVAWSSAGII